MTNDFDTTIKENAKGPKRARGNSGSGNIAANAPESLYLFSVNSPTIFLMASPSYNAFKDKLDQGRIQEAIEHAEQELLTTGEPNAFWLTQLSRALNRAKRCTEAQDAAREALQINPQGPWALSALADACFSSQDWEDAHEYYLELSDNPTFRGRARNRALECLSQLQRWDGILTHLSDWGADAGETRKWRVKALARSGKPNEAIDLCQQWLKEQPHRPEALWELTRLEVKRDGVDTVRERMARLARIPSQPAIYREIHASLCRQSGRFDEAATQYEKLTSAGSNVRTQSHHAFALARSGREKEAIPLLEELLRSCPDDMYLHSSYTASCKRIGELERAWNFYKDLLILHPDQKKLYGRIRKLGRELEKMDPPQL